MGNVISKQETKIITDDGHAKMIKPDIYDVDGLIDARFGKEGTPERAQAEEHAYAFYTGVVIESQEWNTQRHKKAN